MERRGGAAVAVALLAILLAACTAARGPGDGRRPAGAFGGRLELPLDRDPVSLDPARAVDVATSQVLPALFDGLVRADPSGRPRPALAESWRVSRDGRTVRFRLRAGVRFHNGALLDAGDVVFSLQRLLSPATASPRAWVLSDLEGAEAFRAGLADRVTGLRALDARTVELSLVRPSPTLLHRLAMPAAAILDRETLAGREGAEWLPVGTGPFRLVSWRPGEEIEVAAHPGYYAGRPFLDAVRWRVLDREGVLRGLAEGRLGAAEVTPAELEELAERWRWQGRPVRVTPPAVFYVALHHGRRPLHDPLVRQALNHAVDRRALLDPLLPAGYVLADGAIPPGVPGHDPRLRGYPYDPLQARQLLAQAGLAQGFSLVLVEPGTPWVHALNRRLAEMLGRVGVEVRLRTVDRGTFDRVIRGEAGEEADAFVLSWWADYPDPESVLVPLFHSAHFGDGGNRARFASPEVDRALDALRAAADPDERVALARQIQAQIFARAPWIPLFYPVRYLVTQPRLRGFDPPRVPHGESLWDVWWEPAGR